EVSPPQPWSQRRLALGPGVGGEVLIGGRASCPGTARDYRRGRATVSGSTSGRSRSTLVAVVATVRTLEASTVSVPLPAGRASRNAARWPRTRIRSPGDSASRG